MPVLRSSREVAVAVGEALVLVLLPHGGQHRSRRNAWAAMAADAGRARARREAAEAVRVALGAAAPRAAGDVVSARR